MSAATVEILPALLGADPLNYGEAVEATSEAGCGWAHLDVMDGHFVRQITFGAQLAAALADRTRVDVHLQTAEPVELVPAFVRAGAERIAIHVEAVADPRAALEAVRGAGAEACVALSPGTELPEPGLLEVADAVLLMTSRPGTSDFEPDVLEKIRRLRECLDREGRRLPIIADGGITAANAADVAAAGADALVAASAVFAHPGGPGEGVRALLAAAALSAKLPSSD